MYQGVIHFEVDGQLVQAGGAEYSARAGAIGAAQIELNEGMGLGFKPLRGVIVEKRGGVEFLSYIIPIEK